MHGIIVSGLGALCIDYESMSQCRRWWRGEIKDHIPRLYVCVSLGFLLWNVVIFWLLYLYTRYRWEIILYVKMRLWKHVSSASISQPNYIYKHMLYLYSNHCRRSLIVSVHGTLAKPILFLKKIVILTYMYIYDSLYLSPHHHKSTKFMSSKK